MNKISKMSIKLKQLKVKGFKCFSDEKILELSKLTILTGGNSSGKSSILHAVLGAVQSGKFPYKFSPNGKYINMGDFKEISNDHTSRDISLGFTFKHRRIKAVFSYETIWKKDNKNSLPLLKTLILKTDSNHLTLSLKKNTKGYLLDFSYNPDRDPDFDLEKQEAATRKLLDSLLRSPDINTNKKQFERNLERRKKYIENANKKVSFKNFQIIDIENIEDEITKKNLMVLDYTVDAIIGIIWRHYGNIINAISSFRHHPDRTYLEQSKDKLKVDKFGDGYLDQIIWWENNNPTKFKELLSIMRDKFSLLYSLKTNRDIGGGRYEILVKTKKNGIETSLFDVGFGINQFLPIIVADLQLPEGSTLFVAEPEIHLHPNVQAQFGDYLASQIDKNKKNYVIETHSEYLLNRIRYLRTENKIKENDLSIYYLENSGDDVNVHKILFGKNGEIEGAPESFFDTYLMDIKNIALNAVR